MTWFRQRTDCARRLPARRRSPRPSLEALEQRLTLSATPIGIDFRVNTDTTEQQQAPSIAVAPNGNSVVVWESNQANNVFQIFGQLYNASGIAQGAEFQINQGNVYAKVTPKVVMDAGGNFVVAWENRGLSSDLSYGDIFARRFDAAGNALTGDLLVNTTTDFEQNSPSIAMGPSGDFVIAWQSFLGEEGYGIYAQRYSNTATPEGGEFHVNATTAGNQTTPSVAMDATGNFVVAWQSPNQAGPSSGFDIYARRFNAMGVALGGELPINTTIAGDQTNASAAMGPSGDFVIAWQGPDASGLGVFARGFNAVGNPLSTPEYQLNTTTAGDQKLPSVAMNSTSDVIAAWQSPDGQGAGIFARQFGASGVMAGPEFPVNSTLYNDQIKPQVAMNATGRIAFTWETYDSALNHPGSVQDSDVRARFFTSFAAAPAIDLTKYVNGNDANSAPGPVVPVGSTVTFTYTVRNTGNVPLTITALGDDNGTPGTIADDFTPAPVLSGGFNAGDADQDNLLDLTETWQYTATRTAVAGQYTNTAKVTGSGPTGSGAPVTDSDPANYFGAAPAISLVKLTNGTDNNAAPGVLVPVGSTVTFTYLVTNTGNVPLSGVTVRDDNGTPGSTADDFNATRTGGDTNGNNQLDPTETWTFTASRIATPGQYTNVATVTGTPPIGSPVNDTDLDNHFGAAPAIDLTKFVNGDDANSSPGVQVAEGGVVTFTYMVRNPGSVPLSIVSLMDDNGTAGSTADDFSPIPILVGGFNVGDVDKDGLLDTTETWQYTFSALANAGQYTNTAKVTGKDATNAIVTDSDVANYFGTTSTIPLGKGDTATIGFWQNKNGQALIKGLNGSSSSTALGNWLATNFPNLYGASAVSSITGTSNSMAGKTNAQIASLYLSNFFVGGVGAKTDAQVLAVALAVYATDSDLAGGNYAASYGFTVTTSGTGKKSYNVGSYGTAIGLVNNTWYTIFALLDQVDSLAVDGIIPPAAQGAVNSIFDGINRKGDI